MDSSVFFGGSAVAAVVAGSIALLAPCCISVMLPAYFASAFQTRRTLVAMTFLFAAGIATVVLPIAMGAAVLRQLFTEQHTALYLVMGGLMLALGTYTLLGGKMRLPMPAAAQAERRDPSASTRSASSRRRELLLCPRPRRRDRNVRPSFLVWARPGAPSRLRLRNAGAALHHVAALGARRLTLDSAFSPRSVRWSLGPVRRTVTGTAIASGVLLVLMGAGTVVVGLTTDGMPASSGRQADVSLWLQGVGNQVTGALGWVPGMGGGALLSCGRRAPGAAGAAPGGARGPRALVAGRAER